MSSDLAMAVKARAMFGARFKEKDYISLAEKKSIPEIASALKHDPRFATTLEGINEKGIHRGQLEALIRMDIFTRLKKLSRYSGPEDRKFIYLAVMGVETQLILNCIRWFMQEDDEARSSMIASMPIYIEQYMSFDVRKLSDVTSFDELLEVLKGTRYEKIIRRYRADTFEEIDYVGLEHSLKVSYYEEILTLVESVDKGNAQEQMKTITLARIELDNIAIIYRLKKYFHEKPEHIHSLMTRHSCLFKPNEIRNMIDNCTAEEVIEKLQKRYHRYTANVQFTDIEHYIGTIRFNMNAHFMEYYTEPSLVLISYLLLSATEIQNLINIIEGVRYGVSIDRIKALLIY